MTIVMLMRVKDDENRVMIILRTGLRRIVYPRGGRYQKFTMIESTVPLKIPQPTFEWDERVELSIIANGCIKPYSTPWINS